MLLVQLPVLGITDQWITWIVNCAWSA